MDGEELLKSINYFIDIILPKAYYSPDWDAKTITKSFSWALFCEQVYHSLISASQNEDLKTAVQSLIENATKCKIILCSEDLKHASEILTKAFFENPYIENHIFQIALSKAKDGVNDQLLENLNDTLEVNSLCTELTENLKRLHFVDSDRSLYYEVKAELFLEFLKNSVDELTSEDQVESKLSDLLEQLLCNDEKMMILFHLILHNNAGKEEIAEIQEFALNWLLLKMLNDEKNLLSFMWKQPAEKLCTISSKNMTFYNLYADFLTKSADALREVKKESNDRLVPDVQLSFEDVVGHFKMLLCTDGEISKASEELISTFVNLDENPIWRKIQACVM